MSVDNNPAVRQLPNDILIKHEEEEEEEARRRRKFKRVGTYAFCKYLVIAETVPITRNEWINLFLLSKLVKKVSSC